jgi:hypothetical protein
LRALRRWPDAAEYERGMPHLSSESLAVEIADLSKRIV